MVATSRNDFSVLTYALAGLLVLLAGTVAACSPSATTTDDPEKRVLDVLFEDPLFAATPPGTGRVISDQSDAECREGSHEPGLEKGWALRSDGAEVVSFYRRLAVQSGWTTVRDEPADVDAGPYGRRAAMVFERRTHGFVLQAAVDFGLMADLKRPGQGAFRGVTVAGVVRDATFCD